MILFTQVRGVTKATLCSYGTGHMEMEIKVVYTVLYHSARWKRTTLCRADVVCVRMCTWYWHGGWAVPMWGAWAGCPAVGQEEWVSVDAALLFSSFSCVSLSTLVVWSFYVAVFAAAAPACYYPHGGNYPAGNIQTTSLSNKPSLSIKPFSIEINNGIF